MNKTGFHIRILILFSRELFNMQILWASNMYWTWHVNFCLFEFTCEYEFFLKKYYRLPKDVVWWGFDRKCHRYLLDLVLWIYHVFYQHHFPFLDLFHRNYNFGIIGICLTEKLHNIYGHRHWHYTTLNIHTILMDNISEFNIWLMIHHCCFNPFVYSMPTYELDCNLQGHWYGVEYI